MLFLLLIPPHPPPPPTTTTTVIIITNDNNNEANDILQVVIAIAEGFSMFCFLSLVIENLGGVRAAIGIQEAAGEPLICNCANKNYKRFYSNMYARISMTMTVRPIIVLFQAVFMMIGERHPSNRAYKGISSILALISAAILLTAFISLAIFYFSVLNHCANIYGTVKIALLKICVGAIVLQGLAELVLAEYAPSTAQEDDWTGGTYKYLRVYCLLVLAEYSLLAPLFYYAYGSKISSRTLENTRDDKVAPFDAAVYRPPLTFTDFLREIFSFSDTFKNLSYDNESLLSPMSNNDVVNRLE